MKRVDGAFSLRHLVVANLIVKGYSNKAIMNKLFYSKETINKVLRDFYKRYEITGNNSTVKRKGLFELLQKKYKAKTL